MDEMDGYYADKRKAERRIVARIIVAIVAAMGVMVAVGFVSTKFQQEYSHVKVVDDVDSALDEP